MFLVLPFLVFLEFLVLFCCEDFLVSLSVFPFFSRDFRGSVGIKNPFFFFWWFSLPFPKKKGKGRTGYPLNFGGDNCHPQNLGGMAPRKHCKKQGVSDTPPPKFLGVKWHPQNLGGVGLQGRNPNPNFWVRISGGVGA